MKYNGMSIITVFVYILLMTDIIAADLSFQGTTGALETPTADIADKGVLRYQFNNFGEDKFKKKYKDTFNHIFSVGLSDYIEIGGRLTDYRPADILRQTNGVLTGKRDLSGNLKIKLPKISEKLPDIALGINDFAGNAVNFRSQYIVVSDVINNKVHYSIGYASGKKNTALKGTFASLNYNFTSDLSILTEYNTQNYNFGLRYNLSSLTGLPISLKASIPIRSKSNNDPVIAVTFSLPLDSKHIKNISSVNRKSSNKIIKRLSKGSESERIIGLMNKLANYGLENLKAGRYSLNKYIIVVENRIYDHNYMDAIALVLGTAHEFLDDKKTLQVVLLDQGIAKFSIQTSIQPLAAFLTNGKSINKNKLNQQLKIEFPDSKLLSSKNIQWFKGFNHGSSPKFDLKLQPVLKTSVGQEFGLFDYSLALQTDLQMPLWKGANALVSADLALDKSRNYKEGKPFANHRHNSGVKQILLQQYYKPNKNLSTLSTIGKVNIDNIDYNTAQTEVAWTSNSGKHQLSSNLAYFKSNNALKNNRRLVIGSYEYSLNEKDISFEVGYGKFFGGEKGARYRLKKQFGDTEIAAYIKYIAKNDIAGGISIKLPLTPRRAYKNNTLIVRGSPSWKYSLGTTIEDPRNRGSNRLRPNLMKEPKLGNTLSRDYLDSNRLTSSYFRANLDRLREAYFSLSE